MITPTVVRHCGNCIALGPLTNRCFDEKSPHYMKDETERDVCEKHMFLIDPEPVKSESIEDA